MSKTAQEFKMKFISTKNISISLLMLLIYPPWHCLDVYASNYGLLFPCYGPLAPD